MALKGYITPSTRLLNYFHSRSLEAPSKEVLGRELAGRGRCYCLDPAYIKLLARGET